MEKATCENAHSQTGKRSLMRYTIRWVASLAIMATAVLEAFAWQGKASFLKTVAEIPLPGAANRFDYQDLDPETNRLYITHLAGDSVVIFDVKQQKVLTDIPDVPRAHGCPATRLAPLLPAHKTGVSSDQAEDGRGVAGRPVSNALYRNRRVAAHLGC